MKEKKPTLIQCMNCENYRGVHHVLSKVKCDFKPTSDDMRHRSIENDIVDCPVLKFGLSWETLIKQPENYERENN